MRTANATPVNHLLRQERIGRNWRQKDLAEQLGTTTVTVKRWERGYQQPSDYFRIKLCALFGKSAEELGLVTENPSFPIAEDDASGTEQATSSPAEPLVLWTVPYMRNPHFTGRDDLLEQLALRLSFENQRDATTRRVTLNQPQAVKGLGGIGKTQIAAEYAYRVREQTPHAHILWISAASEEAIMNSFATLAEWLPSVKIRAEKDLHTLVATIIRWFEQCPDHWLLIFDNADDLSFVQQYFPKQGNGSVLLTTRAHAVASLASSLEVESLGMMEGAHFLLHRTQRLDATDEEINEAMNIVIALDGFPLALDQAGAYIEETGCSFGDYLYIYEQHRITLLTRRGKQASNYPNSVATTWSLSFEKIEQANPAAADLLRLCAFLAPDHIPEELLRMGATHWSSTLQEAVTDLLTFNLMIEELHKFSLIKRLVEKHTLQIHRLVQVVQREKMDQEEQHYWATCVVRGVNAVFPGNPLVEIATWPQCQRYLEQVQACDLLIQQYALSFSEAADVLNRTGMYLRECALYTLAESLVQRASCIWQQQLGPEHPQVANSLHYLAILYQRLGKYEQAESFYLHALSIREQQLGPEHLDTAKSLNGLATIYHRLGKYKQTESLYLRALDIYNHQLEPNHPSTATCLHNLAHLYDIQGKYEQAEPLYLRALSIREQLLEPEHPEIALALNNLAGLYYTQGKYEQTEPLVKRALQITEQLLGPLHPHTAQSLNNLAELYQAQSKYEQAEPLYLRALSIREQQLGPEHPDTAVSLHDIATLYECLEKIEQVEPLYLRALSIREQQMGPEHPDTAQSLNTLAAFYGNQGKYKLAEPLCLRALSIREQQLGANHLDTVQSLNTLIVLYRSQEKYQQAEPLSQRVLSIYEDTLGPQHPTTQTAHASYVSLQRDIAGVVRREK